ncbi:MAG: 3-oxoacyl-[acyl-carrier-protein] reductase [Bacteroidota bacterium]|nr:3-oxoacyl-[acyl-carrier-protein] reductase [Bacteroidota bacterium]
MKLLEGKAALITGGSRGIGMGIARRMAEQGADIAFTYLSSEEKAKAFEQELNGLGVKTKAYRSDASAFAAAQLLVEDVVKEFGRLDILVNNAGITRDTLLMRMNEAQWDGVMTTNLKSIFNLTKFASAPMLKARAGSIINLSSIVGIQGNAGQANYSASKAGIIGFSKSIARELGSRNIRCNVIAPGFIATEMTGELDEKVREQWQQMVPLKRAGTTEDVANLCVFLASDWSAYITGEVIKVDGGLAM